MSKKNDKPTPQGPAPAPVVEPAPAPVETKPEVELDDVVMTGVKKVGKTWYVLATKINGRRVIDQAVVFKTDFRMEALSELELANQRVHDRKEDLFRRET